jgi:hypothetical protein
MSDEFTAPEEPSTVSHVVDGIQSTAQRVSEAVETAKQPGMPLNVLAKRVREAPLQALAAAFLIGMIVTRRR